MKPHAVLLALLIPALFYSVGCGGSAATVGKDVAAEQRADAAADRGAADARGDATPDGRVPADSRSGTDSKADVKPDLAADAALDVKAETADEIADEPPCVPACEGKECGDDRCGGTCGQCSQWGTCAAGRCVCALGCKGKECGDDGCGESCGECAWPEQCVAGVCVCVPDCDAKVCGPDGCGGTCGQCAAGLWCEGGACGQLKPVHVWSKRMGTPSQDQGEALAVDGEGNIYVTGQLGEGPADLGCGELADVSGYFDAFLLKLSPSGECIWSKRFGSAGTSTAGTALAVGPDGGALLAGEFTGETLDLGAAGVLLGAQEHKWCCYFPVFPSSAHQCSDIFLVRFDAGGQAQWAKSFGACGEDHATAVAFMPGGDILLAGGYQGFSPLDLGGGPLPGQWTGNWYGSGDAFLARLDGSGNHVWSKPISSLGGDGVRGIGCDAQGDVFVFGSFSWPQIDLGGGALEMQVNEAICSPEQTFAACTELFLVKVSPDGVHVWSRSFGGLGYDYPVAMALDHNGAATVVGESDSPLFSAGSWALPIDPGQWSEPDGFIGTVAADGSDVWWTTVSGLKSQGVTGVAAVEDGRIYVTGYSYSSSISIASGQWTLPTCSPMASFLSCLVDGVAQWVLGWCGAHWGPDALSLAATANGCFALAGGILLSEDWGGGPLVPVDPEAASPGDVAVGMFCQVFTAVQQ